MTDPIRSAVPPFEFDAFPGTSFPAVEYGEPWNGWATPVVRREVLADILTAMEIPHRWEGAAAVVEVEDYEDRAEPRADGLYDLAQMGWTVREVDRG